MGSWGLHALEISPSTGPYTIPSRLLSESEISPVGMKGDLALAYPASVFTVAGALGPGGPREEAAWWSCPSSPAPPTLRAEP